MNDFLPISNDDLLMYINIFAIAFVGIFAFIGFIRGFRKSLFYFIATAIIFTIGWVTLDIASDALKTYEFVRTFNLESFNIKLSGIQIKSLEEFIYGYILNAYPQAEDLLANDTLAKTALIGLVDMVVKLLFWLVLIILSFTVFKLLTDVLWMVFKPKRKKGEKRKKTIGSRFGGAGLGSAKGLVYLLLLLFPIGGIASLAGSLKNIIANNQQDLRYNLVFIDDEAVLVSDESGGSDFDPILDLLGLYSKSVPGKVFGAVKADTLLFDYLFSFKVESTNIKLREELDLVAQAFSKSDKLKENGFSVDALLQEDPEVLKDIVSSLSKLKLVKVAIPMGIEASLYLKDESGENVVKLPEGFELNIKDIKSIDFSNDIKKLGYALVDITTLLPSDGEQIEYLNLNPETVKSIFTNIGATDIIDKLAPIAISYVTTLDSVGKSLEQFGFKIEDLKLDEIDKWSDEVAQFGEIYAAIAALQIKKFDSTETFEHVTEEKVEELSNAIFESLLIKNAVPVLVNYVGKEMLPEEYNDQVIIETDIWDAEEFSSLVNAAVTIFKSGILDNGTEALQNLSNETIDDLSKYLSNSKFFTKNLNVIIKSVVSSIDLFGDSEIVVLEANEWTKLELSSLFKSVKFILSEGTDNLTKLDDDKIEELATYLSGSKFITRNISGIVEGALSTIDLGEDIEFGDFGDLEDSEKAKMELYYLFKSASIIMNKGSDINAFLSLNDNELDVMLRSNFISGTLINVIKSFSQPGKQLDFIVGVDNPNIKWHDGEYVNTTFTLVGNIVKINKLANVTKYNIYGDGVKLGTTRTLEFALDPNNLPKDIKVEGFVEGELRRMFIAVSPLASSLTDGGSFSTDTITNLKDEDIDNIMISDILVLSLINQIEELANDEDAFIAIPNGPLTSINQDIKLAAWKNRVENNIVKEGELSKVFKGIRIFLAGQELDDFSIEKITSLSDDDINEVLKSEILSESIIVQIEKESVKTDSIITIPEGENLSKTDPRDSWLNHYVYVGNDLVVNKYGELFHILKGLRVLLDGKGLEDIDVNVILDKDIRETVLISKVIEMTIINKLIDMSNEVDAIISIPVSLQNSPNYQAWKKVEGQGDGELRILLDALNFIIGEDESIEDFTLNLNKIIDNKDEIFKSEVFIETIITKISEQSDIYIPTAQVYGLNDVNNRSAWKNKYQLDSSNNFVYNNGKVVVLEYGEIDRLLRAVDIIIEPDPITGERSLDNDFEFDINSAFDEENQKVFLKSLVISETAVQLILDQVDEGTIYLPPTSYLSGRNDESREKWFSVYSGDTLVEKKELAYLLDAINILTDGSGIDDMDDFDLNKLFDGDNQERLLKSYIIQETIIHTIYDESENGVIKIPSEEYVEKLDSPYRDKWYNKYTSNGIIKGEIAHMLDAANILVDGGDFTGIDFDISKATGANQDIILKSFVISETIVHKIKEEADAPNSIIRIPSDEYVNSINTTYRDKWFNSYNGNTVIKGEIAHLLDAANILSNGGDFSGIDFDISKATGANQNTILRSYIISETIINKVKEESQSPGSIIRIPSDEYVNDIDGPYRDKWYNQYTISDQVIKGELAYLLDAVNIIMDGGNFAGMNFDLSKAFGEDQSTILRSYVISETIVNKIFEESETGSINIPNEDYVNPKSSLNRDKWYNSYLPSGIIKGEIAYMLDAVNILTDGGNFEGIDFDISKAFGANQNIVLRSVVISETIVNKIFEESQNGQLSIPSITYVNGLNDTDFNNRDKWFNKYNNDTIVSKGEIAHLLDSAEQILPENGSFSGITFDIEALFDKEKRDIILKSTVFSESIIKKIINNEDVISSVPDKDLEGRSLTYELDRSAWFNEYVDELVIENELAKFIESIALVVGGDTFTSMQPITIDYILTLTFNYTLTSDKYIINSDFDTLLNSILIENIIAPIALEIANTQLYNYLVVPSGGYNFFKKDLINNFDLSTFDESLYDLKSFIESLYLLKAGGFDYKDISSIKFESLDSNQKVELSDAMVVSRVFKGSIAKLFNELLHPYVFSSTDNILLNKKWEDVMFIQSDYDGTPLESHTNLIEKLDSLADINTYYE